MSNKTNKQSILEESKAVEVVEIVEERSNSAVAENKKQSVMYIGPTITHVVRHSTVFADGLLTESLNKLLGKEPLLNKLLTPLDKIQEEIKELNDKDSSLRAIYDIIKNKYK